MSQILAPIPLLRLLQLASPSLPVGAYAYSQGLESAIEAEWVCDEPSLSTWLCDLLNHSLGKVDLPIFARLYCAIREGDEDAILSWSRRLLAMRETNELVSDEHQRGRALARLLHGLEVPDAERWVGHRDVSFVGMAALASVTWEVPLEASIHAHAWGWLENQVLIGVKLIPLGQVAGQRLLLDIASDIATVCEQALTWSDDDIGGMLPIHALASSRHETQYSRLFRS